MKLLIAGGGTGGHINPAIAIANEFSRVYENSEILFVGTRKGMENTLVPKAGYNIRYIDAEGFQRKNSLYNLVVLGKFGINIMKCMGIIRKYKPDVVVGTGGYVSAPVVLAAHILRIPTLIHEQNLIAGKTTKMLSNYVNRICVAFNDKTICSFPEKTVVTGNPVRAAFRNKETLKSKEETGMDNGLPFIVCVGGSLGAQKINECITEYIKNCYEDMGHNLLVVTGDLYYDRIINELEKSGIKPNENGIFIKRYVYDMEKYLSAADLIISRSGAIFLSEIAYLGKPSVLIPSPNVAENHQEINADGYVKNHAAIKIKESELSWEKLRESIKTLLSDADTLKTMGINASRMSVDNSAELIVKEIGKII